MGSLLSVATLPRMLTPPDVARRLAVKPDRVIAWIRSGELRALNVSDGRVRPRFRIDPADLEEFLARRAVQPPPRRQRRRKRPPDVIEFF